MLGAAFGQDRLNLAFAEFLPFGCRVEGAIALHFVWPTSWPSDLTGHGRHGINQRDQYLDFVTVGLGQLAGQRHPFGIRDLVDLATKFAPIYRTGAGLRSAADRPHVDGIHQEAGEVNPFDLAKMIQQDVMDVVPDAGKIPGTQPPPTGHAAAAVHLLGQILPRDARSQDENDPGKGLAILQGRTSSFGTGRTLGNQRLNDGPELVRQQRLGHVNTLQQAGLVEASSYSYDTLNRSNRPGFVRRSKAERRGRS